MSAITEEVHWSRTRRQPGWLARIFDNKAFLVVACLLPAVGLLTVFLTYPLGLGIYLAFTDTTIGRSGVWIGLIATALFVILLIIFIAQNSRRVTLNFFGWEGQFSLALALLRLLDAGRGRDDRGSRGHRRRGRGGRRRRRGRQRSRRVRRVVDRRRVVVVVAQALGLGLEDPHGPAERAGRLGQALGAEQHHDHENDEDEFPATGEVHGLAP